MSLAALPHRRLFVADRRVPGAFRFVDAFTRLPLAPSPGVRVLGVTLPAPGGPTDLPLSDREVALRMSRSGFHVVFRAPWLEDYTTAWLDPATPPALPEGRLLLRLAVTDAGPGYLPRRFTISLPRRLDPNAPDTVFEPESIELFRAPASRTLGGWAVLRVRVTQTGPSTPLPGVVVRVFASPRQPVDPPLGLGMTDWRGNALGEALVPVAGVPRFRPGTGPNVTETALTVDFEASRDGAFVGAPGSLPDAGAILAGIAPGLVRPPDRPPGSQLQILRPAGPIQVRAGEETSIELAMP